MNDTIEGAAENQITRYANQVRAAFADLPGPDRELLLEDLEDHLQEVAAEGEPILLEAARTLDPRRLGVVIAHGRNAVDPDGVLAAANDARTNRCGRSRRLSSKRSPAIVQTMNATHQNTIR